MRAPALRPAAVAGSWYPGSRGALEREVDQLLSGPRGLPRGRILHNHNLHGPTPDDVVAILSPHAGMMFSGGVAAHAYAAVSGSAADVVVLVGPSHYVGFEGAAVYDHGGFETPLGVCAIDEEVAARLFEATPAARRLPSAHAREHSLEMQLPFLQRVLPSARIVPLVIGYQTRDTIEALGAAIPAAVAGRRALIVASTDLSHYFDASRAEALDGVVRGFVERFDPEGLLAEFERYPEHERGRYVACGGGAAIAAMLAARRLGATRAHVLHYAHSGDVSGDRSAVVGYLAAAFARGGQA